MSDCLIGWNGDDLKVVFAGGAVDDKGPSLLPVKAWGVKVGAVLSPALHEDVTGEGVGACGEEVADTVEGEELLLEIVGQITAGPDAIVLSGGSGRVEGFVAANEDVV